MPQPSPSSFKLCINLTADLVSPQVCRTPAVTQDPDTTGTSLTQSSQRTMQAEAAMVKSTKHKPQFTSRISGKHVVEVLNGFTEFKELHVNEIDRWGSEAELSLKFSAWTMNRVDVHCHAI
jgi:hypothetical protein